MQPHLAPRPTKPNALVYCPPVSAPVSHPVPANVAAIRREILAELEQILVLLSTEPTSGRALDS